MLLARALLVTLALGILAAPLAGEAQSAGKVYRIGYIAGSTAPAVAHLVEAFRQGLREVGWVEGQNIVMEYRYAEGRYERLPALVADLVRLKPDVIVASVTSAVLAAKKATREIPIVMLGVVDPVASGLVASLARPGGNVTGVSLLAGLELVGKGLELLKEAVPKARRVAVLINPSNPIHVQVASPSGELRVAAERLRIEIQVLNVREPNEIETAFQAATRERADALYAIADALFFLHQKRIADLAAKARLPGMYGFRESVEAGGLMAYAVNLRDLWRRAAVFVDKILKGAKAADLPVEQPTKFELAINLKTAKALGLTIPQSVLIRADKLIE